ncbi:MAG: FixH family protein [Deltaproteobacteria bacterium]
MKRLTLVICALFLTVGLAHAANFELTKKAGDYTILVSIDKNPPVTGKNNVVVTIKDGAGKYVTDAKVAVDYGMPAMPGMPAMNYKSDSMLHGTAYHAVVNFSMSGPWTVGIKITQNGKTQSVKLNVDVK